MEPEEKQYGIDSLKEKDLFGNLVVGWNEQFQTLTDLMGLPITRTEAKALRSLINQHLKKSPAELSAIARVLIRAKNPNMESQINLDPERYE
jgi:hypothetical protein